MDFKVRNIQNNKNNLTFQGLKGEINAKNEKTFKFYAPPHKSSEDEIINNLKIRNNSNDTESDQTMADVDASSIIKLNNGDVLYMREINR